jgi:hypothetical protein
MLFSYESWQPKVQSHTHTHTHIPMAIVGQDLLTAEVPRSHSDTPQSVGLLWTNEKLVAATSAWQHTTLTRNRHPCPRQDLNPQYAQASGLKTDALDRAATGMAACCMVWSDITSTIAIVITVKSLKVLAQEHRYCVVIGTCSLLLLPHVS